VAGECDQLLRVAEWELSQIGTRLSRAALSPAIAPTRAQATPGTLLLEANLTSVGFLEPDPVNPTTGHNLEASFNMAFPNPSPGSNAPPTLLNSLQVEADVHDASPNMKPPPPECDEHPQTRAQLFNRFQSTGSNGGAEQCHTNSMPSSGSSQYRRATTGGGGSHSIS
jgi:hypothetical protein